MAAITTAQEYAAVREAIQQLTTLDSSGSRRDVVSITIDGMTASYRSSQLDALQKREETLARRLTIRNSRKRTVANFSGSLHNYLGN